MPCCKTVARAASADWTGGTAGGAGDVTGGGVGRGGVPGRTSDGARGASLTCVEATASGDEAVNGTCPVSRSYSTTPSEYTSLRASTGSPWACSGERYEAGPRIDVVRVRVWPEAAR